MLKFKFTLMFNYISNNKNCTLDENYFYQSVKYILLTSSHSNTLFRVKKSPCKYRSTAGSILTTATMYILYNNNKYF